MVKEECRVSSVRNGRRNPQVKGNENINKMQTFFFFFLNYQEAPLIVLVSISLFQV